MTTADRAACRGRLGRPGARSPRADRTRARDAGGGRLLRSRQPPLHRRPASHRRRGPAHLLPLARPGRHVAGHRRRCRSLCPPARHARPRRDRARSVGRDAGRPARAGGPARDRERPDGRGPLARRGRRPARPDGRRGPHREPRLRRGGDRAVPRRDGGRRRPPLRRDPRRPPAVAARPTRSGLRSTGRSEPPFRPWTTSWISSGLAAGVPRRLACRGPSAAFRPATSWPAGCATSSSSSLAAPRTALWRGELDRRIVEHPDGTFGLSSQVTMATGDRLVAATLNRHRAGPPARRSAGHAALTLDAHHAPGPAGSAVAAARPGHPLRCATLRPWSS